MFLFHNLIFLIIVLLLVSFSPMADDNSWFPSPIVAFGIGMAAYAVVLGVIALQNKILRRFIPSHRNTLLTVTNLDLLAFLIFFHFIIAGGRVIPNSSCLISLFSLSLYLFGLHIFHITAYPYLPNGSRGAVGSASGYATMQFRLIAPFTLPFLLFSFLTDIATVLPNTRIGSLLTQQSDDITGLLFLFAFTGVFLVAMMLFFPPLIQSIWKCKPITNPELKSSLDAVCKKAKFRHAGMKTWTIMNHSYTAGIIGIVPRFRYVMFTKRLLDELPKESIEAILAHEIGHSYRKHLLIYPLIIFGMIVSTGLFSLFFSETINVFFTLQEVLHPSPLWRMLYPLSIYLPFAAIVALYFRFVFGYFSRLFERQADLHVFELGIPPEHMHQALNELGRVTGNTHHDPSWHHHSIIERMTFLERAAEEPSLIEKHHRRVKRNLIGYGILLVFFSCLLLSPLMPNVTPFRQLSTFSEKTSHFFSETINKMETTKQ